MTFAVFILCGACAAKPQSEPDRQPIDASKAEAFVRYQDKVIPVLRDWFKASNASKAEGKVGQYAGGFAEKYKGIGDEVGLSEDELPALSDINAIVISRDPQLQEHFAQLEKSGAAAGGN